MRIAELHPRAFHKADPTSDAIFYAPPRMVAHIDERAIGAVTALYAEHLADGMRVLDLMSSRYSHLPEIDGLHVSGHGMNAAELAANPVLDAYFTRDLNADHTLPLEDDAFDAALCCVSVQYLQRPADVMREVRRTLRPGAPLIVSFSNRCFPTKAVALWHVLGSGEERMQYVAMAMHEAGYHDITMQDALPEGGPGDPLHAVIGRA